MSGTSFRAARRSRAGFDRFGLRNIEISVGHVVEKVGETAQHHTGDDLDNLGIAKTSIAYGRELLVADLAPACRRRSQSVTQSIQDPSRLNVF